jgi:hypothetical protein
MAGGAGDPHRSVTPNPDRSLTRMLFIGNSFTTRNQLPRLLAGIAATAEYPRRIEVDTIWAGGASLRRHWNAGKAQESLASSAWDHAVLQEQSTLPLKNPTRYHENVRLHHEPGLVLYAEDGSHPTAAGSYLSACVFFVSLFDQRPLGWSVSDGLKIDRDTAAKLQTFAWDARAEKGGSAP